MCLDGFEGDRVRFVGDYHFVIRYCMRKWFAGLALGLRPESTHIIQGRLASFVGPANL